VVGEKAFPGINAGGALKQLRLMLQLLDVKDFALFRCHDLRRGHAKDMQLNGASLYEILAAGEWRSPAFMEYLDKYQLETDVVVQAHVGESDDEDAA
jgi:hypothetical protein